MGKNLTIHHNKLSQFNCNSSINRPRKETSMEITREEYEVLIEALGTWENSDAQTAMMSGLMGSILAEDPDEGKKRLEESVRRGEIKTKEKSEIATCLKAKLILLKNKAGNHD